MSATTPTISSPIMAQTCRFLALPAEIHNRIYDLAIEDVLNTTPLPGLAHPHHWSLLPAPSRTEDWSHFRRSYLGLSQTCRQLRSEFLPAHHGRIPITIRLLHLPEYTTTFINDLKVANIKIEFSRTYYTDIRNFLLLCAGTSNITVNFGTGIDTGLSKLLSNLNAYPDFCTYVRERSVRVIVDWGNHEYFRLVSFVHRLEVHVKREFEQEWMRNPTTPENKDKLEC
ncbi:hypothetical protein EJ07DRAFT_158514 [Lizonia empirigonia]|nr:hypothetical protein EJ07DRAFT_158514 [Lizonia empirigonia]